MITCSFPLTEAVHTDGGEEREEENTHRTHTLNSSLKQRIQSYTGCVEEVLNLSTPGAPIKQKPFLNIITLFG